MAAEPHEANQGRRHILYNLAIWRQDWLHEPEEEDQKPPMIYFFTFLDGIPLLANLIN